MIMASLPFHSKYIVAQIFTLVVIVSCGESQKSISEVKTDNMAVTVATEKSIDSNENSGNSGISPIPVSIIVDDVDRVPGDLAEQLMWSTGGGGGGGQGCTVGRSEGVKWNIAYYEGQLSYSQPAVWSAVGLSRFDPVFASIILPDGQVLPLDPQPSCPGEYLIHYWPGPDAELGWYTIELIQLENRLTDSFELVLPADPIGSWYRENIVWLAGFESNERISIYIYSRERFLTNQDLRADAEGLLLIVLEVTIPQETPALVAAEGDSSGRVLICYKACPIGGMDAIFGQ
jgi:hypothetical protein